MNAPLYPLGAFGDGASLWVALAAGLAFGFLLERAGFGSARKLVAQFYLDDLAVLRVMTTAIATAAAGLYLFARVGVLDLSLLSLVETHVWPQLAGGLVLGFGFVLGGYCPGTSIVGAATGRIDALVYACGALAGTFLVGEWSPALAGFLAAGDRGRLTLPEVLHLPYGVVVSLVAALAVGAWALANVLERRFGRSSGER